MRSEGEEEGGGEVDARAVEFLKAEKGGREEGGGRKGKVSDELAIILIDGGKT